MYKGENGQVKISGLGLISPLGAEFNVIAPLDVDKSWQDAPCPALGLYSIDPINLQTSYGCPEFIGFGFHDNCWQLVSLVSRPQPPPMTRLFDVCMTIHDYRHDVDQFFEIYLSSSARLFIGRGDGKTIIDNQLNDYPQHVWDPLNSYSQETQLDTADFMQDSVFRDFIENLSKNGGSPPGSAVQRVPGPDNDRFAALPVELRCMICSFLPLEAFLHLRRASLACSHVFYEESYWKTFFRPFAHWGFVSALGLEELYSRDNWRLLCKSLALALLDRRDMLKRCELWRLAEDILDATKLEWATNIPYAGAGVDKTVVASRNIISYHRQDPREVRLDLQPQPQNFLPSSCLIRKQQIPIPRDLEAIRIWHRMVGCVKYITGISFVTTMGDVTRLGYCGGSGHEWIRIDEKPITGIRARVGERCLESLSFYTREAGEDVLLGESRGALRPETARLMGTTPIDKMEFGFDVRQFGAKCRDGSNHTDDNSRSRWWNWQFSGTVSRRYQSHAFPLGLERHCGPLLFGIPESQTRASTYISVRLMLLSDSCKSSVL